MAKELPYFEFEPAEYLAGNVSFCSLEAQGLFTLVCCYYWQRSCSLTKDQLLKRINRPLELNELVIEGVIKIDSNDCIVINFLNDKYEKATEKSKKNSINGAKGGRPKKPIKTENKPNAFNSLSETKGIREDNIIEDKRREEETPKPKTFKQFTDDDFKNEIREVNKEVNTTDEVLYDFHDYWSEPNTKGKMKFQLEATWDTKRRLQKWIENSLKWAK